MPKPVKTGTTIAGIIFKVNKNQCLTNIYCKLKLNSIIKDGVILGADTRATNGDIVAEKNCEKIHFIAPNI